MKWRLIIPIWTFVCVSLSSSAPVFVQNEMAVMYPMEYYPGYMRGDFNLDLSKWFRKAADSVKQFYNFVNNLIFGEMAREPTIFGRYSDFKETIDAANESHPKSTVHPQELEANVHGIQVLEIYKDEDGNLFMKNLNDPNGNPQPLGNLPLKSIVESTKEVKTTANNEPQTSNGKVAWNPFQWNQTLNKDKLFAGAFQNYAVNSQFLWHSGIFSFQPLSAFNMMNGKVLDQNQASQDQSSQSPGTSVSEISSQNIDLIESSSTSTSTTDQPEPETTTITEEGPKQDETSDNSDSSIDEKLFSSSNESSPYEVIMEVERIKQNNSKSDESTDINKSEPEPESTQGSDIFDETNDEDGNDNTDTETDDNDTETDDNDTETDDDDTDDDDELTDFVTEPIFSENESDLRSEEPESEITKESTQELSNDVNTSEKDGSDSNIVETSSPSEVTEKPEITEETPVTENPEFNIPTQDSDESDIAKKVLAIVQPSQN